MGAVEEAQAVSQRRVQICLLIVQQILPCMCTPDSQYAARHGDPHSKLEIRAENCRRQRLLPVPPPASVLPLPWAAGLVAPSSGVALAAAAHYISRPSQPQRAWCRRTCSLPNGAARGSQTGHHLHQRWGVTKSWQSSWKTASVNYNRLLLVRVHALHISGDLLRQWTQDTGQLLVIRRPRVP
jgi:hypothetical protein